MINELTIEIDKNLNELPSEIRRILLLCFGSLVVVFKELDIKRSSLMLDELKLDKNEYVPIGIEEIISYSRFTIPFGAVRIFWQELLGLHSTEEIHQKSSRDLASNSEDVDEEEVENYVSKRRSFKGSDLLYIANYVTKVERDNFLAAARLHASETKIGSRRSLTDTFSSAEVTATQIRSRSQTEIFESLETASSDDCDAAIKYITDKLIALGFVDTIPSKPKFDTSTKSLDNEDNVNFNVRFDRRRSGTVSSKDDNSGSTFGSSIIAPTSSTIYILEEEVAQEKLRELSPEYFVIKSDLHIQYGEHLFELAISKGGFALQSFRSTVISLNEVMVAACFRQRKHVRSICYNSISDYEDQYSLDEKYPALEIVTNRKSIDAILDDASFYAIRSLPSHLMRAERMSAALSLLASSSFLHERFNLLMIEGTVSRVQRDLKEFYIRKFKKCNYGEALYKIFLEMKNCLVERHPISRYDYCHRDRIKKVGETIFQLATTLKKRGLILKTIIFYHDALQYLNAGLAPGDTGKLRILCELGGVYIYNHAYSDALIVYEEGLATIHSLSREQIASMELFELEREALEKIALLHGMMGNHERSITFYEDALIVLHKVKGRDSMEAVEIYSSLGNVLHLLNFYEKSLFCYKESLRLMKQSPEEFSSQFASIHYKLGILHSKNGNYGSAIDHCSEAMKLENSSDIAWSILHLMGTAYSNSNKHVDSVTCFKKSLEIKKTLKTDCDGDDAKINLNLAKAYCDLELYDDSLRFYEVGKAIVRTIHGESKEYLSVLRNIAYVYCKKGDIPDSLLAYDMALEVSIKKFGEEHINTANILQEKGNVLMATTDVHSQEKGMDLYSECVKIKSRILGNKNGEVVVGKNNLAVMYLKMNNHDKALLFFTDVLEAKKHTPGNDNYTIADVHQIIGLLHKSLKKHDSFDLAVHHFKKALEIRKSKLEKNDPKVYDTMYNLGIALTLQRDFSQALEFFEESLAGYESCSYESSNSVIPNIKKWIMFAHQKKNKEKVKVFQRKNRMKKDLRG